MCEKCNNRVEKADIYFTNFMLVISIVIIFVIAFSNVRIEKNIKEYKEKLDMIEKSISEIKVN